MIKNKCIKTKIVFIFCVIGVIETHAKKRIFIAGFASCRAPIAASWNQFRRAEDHSYLQMIPDGVSPGTDGYYMRAIIGYRLPSKTFGMTNEQTVH